MNRIICVDWGHYIHKGIYSRAPVATSTIILRMLIGDLKKVTVEEDDIIIIACDNYTYENWRRIYFPQYKANRKVQREKSGIDFEKEYYYINQLQEQLDLSTPLRFYNLSCLMKEERYGLEADDIMSYVVRANPNAEVTIVSADSDLEQLAYFDNCKIFSPISKKYKKITNPLGILNKKIMGSEAVDNLHGKVTNEYDYKRKEKVVNLTSLPDEVELACEEAFDGFSEKPIDSAYLPKGLTMDGFNKIYVNNYKPKRKKLYKQGVLF